MKRPPAAQMYMGYDQGMGMGWNNWGWDGGWVGQLRRGVHGACRGGLAPRGHQKSPSFPSEKIGRAEEPMIE